MLYQLARILIVFIPQGKDSKTKDQHSRLHRFLVWLSMQQGVTFTLADYRDYLLYVVKLAPSSVKSHLSSIRVFLRELIKNPVFKESLLKTIDPILAYDEREKLVDLQISRLREAIEFGTATVKYEPENRRNLNITEYHISNQLSGIKIDTPIELRDTAIITLMVATGIRETEICALDVSDLRHEFEGELALHVPRTQGGTERYVPYFDMKWVLEITDTWIKFAGIESGPVFRGFYKSGNLLRPNRLSVRSIVNLLANYPIQIEGREAIVKPLDIRHLYARHLYSRHKIEIEKMQQYLGIRSLETFWSYIGDPSDHRYEDFDFDMYKLGYWKKV
jgi:site-specific recombinase XerC